MGKKIAVSMAYDLMQNKGIDSEVIKHISGKKQGNVIEIENIAANGLRLFKYFNPETEKIVIIDSAVKSEEIDQTMDPSEDQDLTKIPRRYMSLHGEDIQKIINLGKKLFYPIPEIKILVVEPESEQAGKTGSPDKMNKVIEQIIEELS